MLNLSQIFTNISVMSTFFIFLPNLYLLVMLVLKVNVAIFDYTQL